MIIKNLEVKTGWLEKVFQKVFLKIPKVKTLTDTPIFLVKTNIISSFCFVTRYKLNGLPFF